MKKKQTGKKIVDLLDDPKIRHLYDQYQTILGELEVDYLKQHHRLKDHINKFDTLDTYSNEKLAQLGINKEQFELSIKASRLHKELHGLIMAASYCYNPAYSSGSTEELKMPFKSTREVEIEFLGSTQAGAGLFQLLWGSDSSHVQVIVRGNNSHSWLTVTWGVTVPNIDSICGIEIIGFLGLQTGLVYNKSESEVRVNMNYGIAQYRGKALHEINTAIDIPYRNIHSCCQNFDNNTMYPYGYTDDIYGWHEIEPLFSEAWMRCWNTDYNLALICEPGSSTPDMQYGDVFLVGAWFEINVPYYSLVDFSSGGIGTLFIDSPGISYWEIDL
jgi:hypothetical protein